MRLFGRISQRTCNDYPGGFERLHARVRQRDGEYYLADLNSRNGTAVNGTMLKGGEEYLLQDEDQVDFAQARYVFVK